MVTLRCEGGLTFDNFVTVKPIEGGERRTDRMVWTFENLEPTTAHDISFSYGVKTRAERVARARKTAKEDWAGRVFLVKTLLHVRELNLRSRMTDTELTGVLAAWADVIPTIEKRGAQVVLPVTDPAPSYYRYPQKLLRLLPTMTEIVLAHPDCARTREHLQVLIDVAEALPAQNLLIGDEPFTIHERSRDKLRSKVAGWVRPAREALRKPE